MKTPNCEACSRLMWQIITMTSAALLFNARGSEHANFYACSNDECMWYGVVVVKKITNNE